MNRYLPTRLTLVAVGGTSQRSLSSAWNALNAAVSPKGLLPSAVSMDAM